MTVIFTNKALDKMKQLSITEDTVRDVYTSGEERLLGNFHTKQKKHFNLEIGVVYTKEKMTGNPIIVSVWKRTNRR